MNGIIIVDKPVDWTSHDVVAKLRGALKIKRVGHGGTLDPMATGVLPVFIGIGTRAAEFCENADKEYIAGLKLGISTDTQDITGSILEKREVVATQQELLDVIPRFIGAQKQIPPMYSAAKVGGKKLYELARRGIEVERAARDIVISDIELLECSDDNEYLLKVACSKGTYIRTLCHDIGASLGCGGTMSSLRRLKAGVFNIDMAHTLRELLDAIDTGDIEEYVIAVDAIFAQFPSVYLDEANTRKCKNGAQCHLGDIPDSKYRFYSNNGEFIMLGETRNGTVKAIKRFYS